MPATAADVAALCAAAHEASLAAPRDRRRYWLLLRDAAGALHGVMEASVSSPKARVDADVDRRGAEREVRVAATLCLAACRRAAVVAAPETAARLLISRHVYDGAARDGENARIVEAE